MAIRPASPDPVAASPLYEVEPTFPGVRPTVTWLRSLEQGGFIARTAATVVEFFILIGCFFSVVGILVWNDGVREHQRQEDNAIADEAGGIGGGEAPAANAPNVEDLENQLQAARQGTQQANQRANAASVRAHDAGQREAAANRQVTDLTAQVQTLTTQLADAQKAGGSAAKLAEQNTALQARLADMERALREHQTKAGQQEESLRAEVTRLTQALGKAQQGGDAALQDLRSQLASARTDLATAQGQSRDALADAQRQIADLQAQLTERGRALTTAQAGAGDAAQLRTQLSQAQAESQRLQTALNAAETARKTLSAQNAELTTAVQAASQASQQLNGQMQDVTRQLQESNRTKGTQGEEITRLRAQLGTMTDKAKADAALKERDQQIAQLKETLAKVGETVPKEQFTDIQEKLRLATIELGKRAIKPEDLQALRNEMSALRLAAANTELELRKQITTIRKLATETYNKKMAICSALTPDRVREMQGDQAMWTANWAPLDLDKEIESRGKSDSQLVLGGAGTGAPGSSGAPAKNAAPKQESKDKGKGKGETPKKS